MTPSRTSSHRQAPRFAILLAVYNGAGFLERQIETLERQTVGAIDVWASDDGSTDGSAEMLADRAQLWSRGDFHIRGARGRDLPKTSAP